jgi:lipoprotein-releasing system ATP-binding protein
MDEPVPAIIMNDVTRIYKQGTETLNILKGIDLCVKPGEVIGLIGSSGTGKSTLLHIAGLLEFQNSGEIYIAGESCTGMNDDARTKIRREKIGFVYQFHHLLPEFTALENIIIPQIISGLRSRQASERAPDL